MKMWEGSTLFKLGLWLMVFLSLLIIPVTCYAVQDDEGNEEFYRFSTESVPRLNRIAISI
jgi:hypothetical protein